MTYLAALLVLVAAVVVVTVAFRLVVTAGWAAVGSLVRRLDST